MTTAAQLSLLNCHGCGKLSRPPDGRAHQLACPRCSARLHLRKPKRQVLQELAEGRSQRESAERLNISEKAIEVHRRNIRQRLGISSIAELTKYAIRMGITDF